MNNSNCFTNCINNRRRMETKERCSSTSSSTTDEPLPKKRKLSDDNDSYQEELKSMKLEFDEQKDTVCGQANTIRKLQKERDTLVKRIAAYKNMEVKIEKMENVEAELRTKNTQLKAKERNIKELQEELKECQNLQALLDLSQGSETFLNKRIDEMEEFNANQIKLLQDEIVQLKAAIEEHKRQARKMEAIIESKRRSAAALQINLAKMEENYKAALKKNEELVAHHEKEMATVKAEMQTKIDNDRGKYDVEINRLKAANDNLLKKVSQEPKVSTQKQDKTKERTDKITVSATAQTIKQPKDEKPISSQRKCGRPAINTAVVAVQDEKPLQELKTNQSNRKPGVRYFSLDEVRDGSNIAFNRLSGHSDITVLKIDKFEYRCNDLLVLFSYTETGHVSGSRSVRVNLSECLKNNVRIQIDHEFKNISKDSIKNVMPLIDCCYLTKLDFADGTIEYEDFKKLVSSGTITTFIAGSVKRENGEKVGIVEIFKELPNIKCFEISEISEYESQKLVELPYISTLQQLTLASISRSFDFSALDEFIQKYSNVEFHFKYDRSKRKSDCNKIGKIEKEHRKRLSIDFNVTFE